MPLTHTTFFDRPAYHLSNSALGLTVIPALSGRIMELKTGRPAQNHLWINDPLLAGQAGGDPAFGGWKNWGGYKTWLAPQSRWPDPMAQSDAVDNVEWEVIAQTESLSAASLSLRGPMISWGGVYFGRQITVRGKSRAVSIRETITNGSSEPRTWAVWAVAQFPVPGHAAFPPAAIKAARALHAAPPKFRGGQLRFDGKEYWKVGALSAESWAQYQAKPWPRAFRVSFPPHADLPHPDDYNLEAWNNTRPAYMELEWLGPLVTLKPGESWAMDTEWHIDSPTRRA